MNFFKSVFSDEADPPTSPPESPNPSSTETQHPTTQDGDESDSDPDQINSNPTTPSSGWGFGGLLKTLQVKPDWIETYRRDLEEFGTGLKKETQILREAVKDLPTSVESVGSTVWKSTTQILSQGKESLLPHDDTDSSDSNLNAQSVPNSGKYSRFDAQLRAIQCDSSTYIDEPDDVSEYDEWKSGFDLGEKSEEIENLMRENGTIDGVYKRVVPDSVDHDVFWYRYYYRVHKLKQAENVRAKLVKRAISTEDEEELSWDVDEEEEEEEEGKMAAGLTPNEITNDQTKVNDGENEDLGVKDSEKNTVNEDKLEEGKEVQSGGSCEAKDVEEKVLSEGKKKSEPTSESGKESDISIVSTQPLSVEEEEEEDDMGWDEIEDIGSEDDEKKVKQSDSPNNNTTNRVDLKKRLSASVDEDEDLSWDIEEEEDDEPVKKKG